MVKLSENYEREIARRETPGCYGNYKNTSDQTPEKCGFCWFVHACKENRKLNKNVKVSVKVENRDSK